MMKLEYPSRRREDQNIPLPVNVDLLKKSVEEVQKYELLTTPQYLQQMELLIEILQDISQKTQKGRETT
jgi:hypothetical protein